MKSTENGKLSGADSIRPTSLTHTNTMTPFTADELTVKFEFVPHDGSLDSPVQVTIRILGRLFSWRPSWSMATLIDELNEKVKALPPIAGYTVTEFVKFNECADQGITEIVISKSYGFTMYAHPKLGFPVDAAFVNPIWEADLLNGTNNATPAAVKASVYKAFGSAIVAPLRGEDGLLGWWHHRPMNARARARAKWAQKMGALDGGDPRAVIDKAKQISIMPSRKPSARASASEAENEYVHALVAELRHAGGRLELGRLGARVPRPDDLTVGFKSLLESRSELFALEKLGKTKWRVQLIETD